MIQNTKAVQNNHKHYKKYENIRKQLLKATNIQKTKLYTKSKGSQSKSKETSIKHPPIFPL